MIMGGSFDDGVNGFAASSTGLVSACARLANHSANVAASRMSRIVGLRFMLVRRHARAGVALFLSRIENRSVLHEVVWLQAEQITRLLRIKIGIESVAFQQFSVCALFEQAALV